MGKQAPPTRAAPSLVKALRDARGALLFATWTSMSQCQEGVPFPCRSGGPIARRLTAYRLLVAQRWTDALRQLHPGEHIYTFWKYFRNAFPRDAGLRIDHLLLSPPVAERLISAGVDRDVRGREHASDHAPAWIELAGATAAAGNSRGRRTVSSQGCAQPDGDDYGRAKSLWQRYRGRGGWGEAWEPAS